MRRRSIAVRSACLLALAAGGAAIWIGTTSHAPADTSPRVSFLAGRFTEARDACRLSLQGAGSDAAAARRDLPFLEAVAWGSFDAAIDALRSLHAAEHDFESIARTARLLALRGERDAALRCALEAVAFAARPHEKAELLECVLAGMDPSAAVDSACPVLLALDPWNAVARSALFRGAVLRDDFAQARARWRDLYFVDLLADELFDAAAADVEALFAPAATAPAARWQLGRALAARDRWPEAAHCLRDAEDEASLQCRARAERFRAFAQTFDKVCVEAFSAGIADGRARQVVTAALPALCKTLGAATTAELYAALRDEYGLYCVLLSSGPLSVDAEATEILQVDAQQAPAAMNLGRVRRVVTGAPRFRMAWALSPLTLGEGAKDVFRSDWPDTVVLHATWSIAQAAEAHAIASGVQSDPSADRAPMSDPDAPPRVVASAFRFGNQGNRCFQRMRDAATREAARRSGLPPGESQAARAALVGVLAQADLHAAALHEMRHISDHRYGSFDRAERERRAFLTELELAPVPARYLRLGIVATGGTPSEYGDPYETANFQLLAGFIRTLADDPKVAPHIDRTRNLQAQLHLLEPDEIAEVARRIGASRSK